MITQEETEAIQCCQQGDITGLELLVVRYQLPAIRTAYLLIGDRSLAEDIVQESFLTAYRHMHQFDLAHPFAPWFYRIVTNTARQWQRKTRRHPSISFEQIVTSTTEDDILFKAIAQDGSETYDPVVQTEQNAERTALLEALSTLTVKQREAVILRYYCGFSEQEMANLLHCLPGTVKWRLHAGLHALEHVIRQRFAWLIVDRWTRTNANTASIALSLREESHHVEL